MCIHFCINIFCAWVCVGLNKPTYWGAGDGLDLVQSLRQAVLDLCVLQREQISCSGQIPLTQHLAKQLVHPGPGLGVLADQAGTAAVQFKVPQLIMSQSP